MLIRSILVVWLLACTISVSHAVASVKSSFMQVEPEGNQCLFRYFGLEPDRLTVARRGWIQFSFFHIVEGDVENRQLVDRGPRYYLDGSNLSSVSSYSIFNRTRVTQGNVLRTELVQIFNLTNGASALVTNSFFNTSTNITFDTQQGRRVLDVSPLIAKLTIAVYNWPWIDKRKHKLHIFFGMDFNIFGDAAGAASEAFSLPQITGVDDGGSEFVIKGSILTTNPPTQYEVVLLKFGVDGNNTEIPIRIDLQAAISALPRFFFSDPPVFKFNATMRIEPFSDYVEYDPNFLLLLGEPITTPVSPEAAALVGLDSGITAGISIACIIFVFIIILIVLVLQRKKFNAKIRVRVDSTTGNIAPAPTTTPKADSAPANRWRAFSSADARSTSTLKNADG